MDNVAINLPHSTCLDVFRTDPIYEAESSKLQSFSFSNALPFGSKSLHFGCSRAERERGLLPFWWVLQPLLR